MIDVKSCRKIIIYSLFFIASNPVFLHAISYLPINPQVLYLWYESNTSTSGTRWYLFLRCL